MIYKNAISYKCFEVTILIICFILYTYYRHCERYVLPTMLEVDESYKGTIDEQMFYNRKSLKEIIELRYSDVNKKVSL